MVPAVRSGPLPYAKTAPMTQCSMGAVWAVMHVFPLFPLDGAKSARFQAQRPFSRKPPAAIVGYFTMVKQSGNSCSPPCFAPPKRRVYYEAIAL